MDKKYELIESDLEGFYRIKALRSFGDVKKGDIGGYVENEHNLSHTGACWIYDNARVCDNATVRNNAIIYDNATIYGNTMVYNSAMVYGNAKIYANTQIYGNAMVHDNALIYGNVKIHGTSVIEGNAYIRNDVEIQEGRHIGRVTENFQSILYIQGKKRMMTVYKDINNIIKCTIDSQSGMTLEDLLKKIEIDGSMREHKEEYVRIMQNAHLLLG